MLDPVLAIRKLQSKLRDKRNSSSDMAAVPRDDAEQAPCEKLKVSTSSPSNAHAYGGTQRRNLTI